MDTGAAKVSIKISAVKKGNPTTSRIADHGVAFPAFEVAERRSLNFKPTDDITIDFRYMGANSYVECGSTALRLTFWCRPDPADISKVEIHGIHKAVANLTKDEVEESNVDVNVKIDGRGMLHTANAVLTYTTKPEAASVKDKLKGLFGGSKDKAQDGAEVEAAVEASEEDLEFQKPKEKKIGLRFTEHVTGVKPMSAEERRNARKRYVKRSAPSRFPRTKQTSALRLAAIDAVERAAIDRGNAINHLEGYLYRVKNMLSPDATNTALQDFSSSHERTTLAKAVEEAFEWMAEHVEAAETAILHKKREVVEYVLSLSSFDTPLMLNLYL